jgi:hypothetical protein
MARDASLVPISTAWIVTEANICVWFVRLCKSCVTGSQIRGRIFLCAFYLMLSVF